MPNSDNEDRSVEAIVGEIRKELQAQREARWWRPVAFLAIGMVVSLAGATVHEEQLRNRYLAKDDARALMAAAVTAAARDEFDKVLMRMDKVAEREAGLEMRVTALEAIVGTRREGNR